MYCFIAMCIQWGESSRITSFLREMPLPQIQLPVKVTWMLFTVLIWSPYLVRFCFYTLTLKIKCFRWKFMLLTAFLYWRLNVFAYIGNSKPINVHFYIGMPWLQNFIHLSWFSWIFKKRERKKEKEKKKKCKSLSVEPYMTRLKNPRSISSMHTFKKNYLSTSESCISFLCFLENS